VLEEVDGVQVGIFSDFPRTEPLSDLEHKVARAYIAAARDLEPENGFEFLDIEYAKNNLFYVASEWDETATTWRVFVPFQGPSEAIKEATALARLRALMVHDDTVAEPEPPQSFFDLLRFAPEVALD